MLRALPYMVGVALLIALAGCNRNRRDPDILAQVNGHPVTRSEVDKYYQNQIAGSGREPSDEQARLLRLNILRELIDNEILMQRAEKLELVASDEEVEGRLTEIKAPYTEEEFKHRMEERNVTLDDFKKDLRRTLTIQKLLNKEINAKISITDKDIEEFYNQNRADFNFVEPQYHLAQILVTTAPSPQAGNRKSDKAQNPQEAREKIEMIRNRLQSGEDFATVAMNYSEQPATAPSGGDLGFIPESSLKSDPGAWNLVSSLRPGQISEILPVYDGSARRVVGYRILKLIAKEPAGQRDLNDPRVQQAIREQLRTRREQLLKSAYYEVVRNDAKVENYFAQNLLESSGTQ